MKPHASSPSSAAARSRRWPWLFPLGVFVVVGALWWSFGDVGHAQRGPGGARETGPQPVTASVARTEVLHDWATALGTVTPRSLVNVMPRVSGLLQSVDYKQGQMVKAGQVLAVIDPRPFRIAVQQAQAQVEQTQAQLAGAERDLARYETLLKQDSIAEQTVSDQRATVAQLKATLDANKAALDNDRLQLSWTRITAPVSGLTGLRKVDAGNMVNTSGAVGGGSSTTTTNSSSAVPIAVIAQIQPVDVTFALPQRQVEDVVGQLMAGKALTVQAWDARNARLLDTGKLIAADNQINTSTGTLDMRAAFANKALALFPNAFVNVRLLVRTLPGAVVVPSTAVAVGAPGTYVYVIGEGDKVSVRKVSTGLVENGLTQISSGLKAGERVVTDGLDKLRDGAAVKVVPSQRAEPAAGASAASRSGRAAGGAG